VTTFSTTNESSSCQRYHLSLCCYLPRIPVVYDLRSASKEKQGSYTSNSLTLIGVNVGLLYSLLIVQRLSVQSSSFYILVNSRLIDYILELLHISMNLMIKKKLTFGISRKTWARRFLTQKNMLKYLTH
jgi:hypothetical protein